MITSIIHSYTDHMFGYKSTLKKKKKNSIDGVKSIYFNCHLFLYHELRVKSHFLFLLMLLMHTHMPQLDFRIWNNVHWKQHSHNDPSFMYNITMKLKTKRWREKNMYLTRIVVKRWELWIRVNYYDGPLAASHRSLDCSAVIIGRHIYLSLRLVQS